MTVPWMKPAIAAVIATWMKGGGRRGGIAIPRRRGKHLQPIGQSFDFGTLLSFVIWHACGWGYPYFLMTFIDGVSVINYPIWRSWMDYRTTLWSDWIHPWCTCSPESHTIPRLYLEYVLTNAPLPTIANYDFQRPIRPYWSIDSYHNFIYQVGSHGDLFLILGTDSVTEQLYFGAKRIYERLNALYATYDYRRMPADDTQAMACAVILVKLCYRLDDNAL